MWNQDSPWAIEVKGLVKTYGGQPVLQGLDLQLAWGECLTLFGPNGSGKTTLIKVLATLSKADAGQIRIAGRDLHRHAVSLRRAIGVVSHPSFLYEELTVEENLKFYGRMFGVQGLEEQVRQTAFLLGIEAYLGRRVRTLSNGMKKRTSIARAILHRPPILLLDEPETGLDQEALHILELLLVEGGAGARAVLLTTHNLEQGLSLGSRVAILAQGRIAYQAPREFLKRADLREIYSQYTGVLP